MPKKFFILNIILFQSLTPIYAQTENALSLETALKIAFQNNPKIVETRQGISASNGRWIQAEAFPDPEFELAVGGFKEGEKGADTIAIRQPLDPIGTRFLRGRIAYDEVKIARSGLDLAWNDVSVQVRQNYASILALEKAVETSEDNLKATRQFLTQVQTKFQAGSALKSDLIRARIENSRAENELLIAQKDLKVTKGRMSILLGRPPDTHFSLADKLRYEPLRYEYENLITQALSKRADVQAETRRLTARRRGVWNEILKVIFPKMSIGLERTTEDFDNDTALLIGASYPLWGFNWGRVKEAKAEKKKQETRFEALERVVHLDVYEAFLEAELADKQVQLQKKSLEESHELLRQITLQ